MAMVVKVLEEKIDSTKGIRIHVRSWRPESTPRAAVVICHGVNSHGGQYTWVGEQFAASGFAAYALDLRGRGQSDGERFYVEHIADYVSDVSATVDLAKSREPGLPVFLLGHSAGGVVSSTYVLEHEKTLAGFRTGRPVPVSGEDARDVLEVIAACYHAAATGHRVVLDAAGARVVRGMRMGAQPVG